LRLLLARIRAAGASAAMAPDVVRTASAVGIVQRREVVATTDVEPMTSGGSAAGTIYAEGNTVAAFHLVAPTDDALRSEPEAPAFSRAL